jgi:hypothetical protein
MKRTTSLILATASILSATGGVAAPLIERDGRYELNWTTGKVRFYGVGQASQGDENYRSAEQAAWADGLKAAEKYMPTVMANRVGPMERLKVEKLSKLAQSTISISTTYFGDQRVKVLLEAPMQKMTSQLVASSEQAASLASDAQSLIVNLPKGARPVAFLRVIDEHGRDMLTPAEMIAAAHAGAPLSRWYRHEAPIVEKNAQGQEPSVISAVMAQKGIIRVQSSEWKPAFAKSIVQGRTAFIVD